MDRRENLQMPLKNALPTAAIIVSLAVALFGNGIVSDGYDQTLQTNIALATIKTTLEHQIHLQKLSLSQLDQVESDIQTHGMTLFKHEVRLTSLEKLSTNPILTLEKETK